MSSDHVMGPAQLRERDRIMRLRPTEADFRGRQGYERFHVAEVGGERVKVQGEAPDGTYKWAYNFTPNDHGKLTREAAMVGEMMQPFTNADAAARSGSSGAALTEDTGRSRGRSRMRVGGSRVECRAGGRWCLTTPFPWTPVPDGGNPDGTWA